MALSVSRMRHSYSPGSGNVPYYDHPSPSPTLRMSNEDLVDIINVDPCPRAFTCVGYAPSKGRRCHNPIAQANRSYASRLLAEGSDRLSRGESVQVIRNILERLAPLVLCRRWHQDQARTVARKWAAIVADYLEEHQPPHVSISRNRPAHHMLRTGYTSERGLPFRVETGSSRSVPTPARSPASSSAGSTTRSTYHSPSPRQSTVPPPVTPSVPSIGGGLFGSTAPAQPAVEPRRPRPTIYAARRRIRPNEECPICHERLLPPWGTSLHYRTLNRCEIDWCKAQCGTNLHSRCIRRWRDEWLSVPRPDFGPTRTEATCPLCVATWLDSEDDSIIELDGSEETEAVNRRSDHNIRYNGSQQLRRGRDRPHGAADDDSTEAEEQASEEAEEQAGEEVREQGGEEAGEAAAEDAEHEHGAEVEQAIRGEEREETTGGNQVDEPTEPELVTIGETDGDIATDQDTEGVPTDSSEVLTTDISAFSRQQTPFSESDATPNQTPGWPPDHSILAHYLDAIFLLLYWTLYL